MASGMQAVEGYGQQTLVSSVVVRPTMAEQLDQLVDVNAAHVLTQRAGSPGSVHQALQKRVGPLRGGVHHGSGGDRAGDRGEGASAERNAGLDEAGQRVPRFATAPEAGLGSGDLLFHRRLTQVLEECFFARVAAVQAAHAHAGCRGDGTDGRLGTLDGEDESGSVEHGAIVASGFGLASARNHPIGA